VLSKTFTPSSEREAFRHLKRSCRVNLGGVDAREFLTTLNLFSRLTLHFFQGRFAVIKLDIINQVVERTGIPRTKAELAVDSVFEAMKAALRRDDRIELRGFGVFTIKPRKTGIGRNPRTGEEVSIPPGKAVRFKPGKDLQSV
jgi:DNA-binding protein HU-beta